MPLSVHDEFRKPPMRSRSTKSSASGLDPASLESREGDGLSLKIE